MQHDAASTAASAAPYPVPARLGVKLTVDQDNFCHALPEPAPWQQIPPLPVLLPRLQAEILHNYATLAQTLWRDCQRQMIVVFYLDVAQAQWRPVVPAQQCGYSHVQCRLAAPQNPWGVTVHERLAASLRSLHVEDPARLALETPAFDGIHVFLDLATDNGFSFWSYRRAGEVVVLLDQQQVVMDEGRRWLDEVSNRLHLLDDGPQSQPSGRGPT